MTAALTGILALALCLLLAPSAGPGRRLRKVLSVPSGRHLPEVLAARLRRWRGRFPRRGRGAAASEVPLTVLVQQLAALLKGGRTPARMWEDLWQLYGDPASALQPPDSPGRHDGTAGRSGALGATSREILAAARAAALRGLPVAAAIRARASPERGRSAPRGSDRGEQAVWMDLAACFDVADASGCPLADVLTRFAAHLESEGDARAARETALAGPKATARILTWLPFLGLGVGLLLGVEPWAILLGSPWGMTALIAGLALTASGRFWSARLVRAAAGRQP
ncbi:hypothetical protein FFF93_014170 [Arthrobacter sp. KBS0702]|uniref:type II secretion system F family protein n=1 Tax=Arthrobacter sp. KBS0702 TaxID=2578107 RepID=UPI00110EAF00|nr:hypothetical protein [Arthrobacter sp. KBS0702]QDW30796.1 hypothetical protein FFF93_014170 [Arthrobacter sp. KBS0702]